MSTLERVWNVSVAVASIICACIIVFDPVRWYPLVVLLLSINFAALGISRLWYYITMARHMVGGQAVFYRGVFFLDFGLFSASLAAVPNFYVRLYLAATHLFAGLVDILRAREKQQLHAPSWKQQLIMGVIRICIGLACLFFIRKLDTMMYIYAVGLFIDAGIRLVSALRTSDIVSIQ